MYPISFYIYIYILYIYYTSISTYTILYIYNISYFYVNDILYQPGPSLEVTYSLAWTTAGSCSSKMTC